MPADKARGPTIHGTCYQSGSPRKSDALGCHVPKWPSVQRAGQLVGARIVVLSCKTLEPLHDPPR